MVKISYSLLSTTLCLPKAVMSSVICVGRLTFRLPKEYHLTDIPKFAEKKDGYKRPFCNAERKKKMLRLNRPYRYALAKQHKSLPPEYEI